ncbi:MAG: cytochrome-c peroxidase [Kofleriaceae bacterium]
MAGRDHKVFGPLSRSGPCGDRRAARMIRRLRIASRSARGWLAATVVLFTSTCAAGSGEPAEDHDAQVVALGRMVFLDPALSADGRVSCASCHKPEQAYTDGLAHATGNVGRQGTRNTPSLLDVGRQRSLFWDGRRTGLEDQAFDPVLNAVEHGLHDEAELVARLRADARYAPALQAAFGISARDVTGAHVARALAAFERTLRSGPAPFDRFLRGDRNAIPEAARQGWVVFDQQAHCTRCHVAVTGDGEAPLFTDHEFHSLAVGFSKVERKLPELTRRPQVSQTRTSMANTRFRRAAQSSRRREAAQGGSVAAATVAPGGTMAARR